MKKNDPEATPRKLSKPAPQGAEMTREELVVYTDERGGGSSPADDAHHGHRDE